MCESEQSFVSETNWCQLVKLQHCLSNVRPRPIGKSRGAAPQDYHQRCLIAPECAWLIGWICIKSQYCFRPLSVALIAHAKKKTFLFFFVLGLGCVPCCSSPSWLGGVRKGIRKVSNDLQRRQMIFMYIYIYTFIDMYIYKYTYMYIYAHIFAKDHWLRVRGRVPSLPLLFRSPPPAEKNALSFTTEHALNCNSRPCVNLNKSSCLKPTGVNL